ncbi:MAG TPA: ABC transporter permease [Vicinamibacterales bacterium]|nr:ABC transporter permease [Vicinamibacterales bacterium]
MRFALRRLLHRKAATFVSIVTLGCAIGAAAATWSLFSALVVNPLPVTAPDRLMSVVQQTRDRAGEIVRSQSFLFPEYENLRASGAFGSLAAGGTWPLMVGTGSYPERRDILFANHEYFSALGVPVALGREFNAADDVRGAAPVAILSDRFWRTGFDADLSVVGRQITVGNVPTTVIGVAPPAFRGLDLSAAPTMFMTISSLATVGNPAINYFADPTQRTSPSSWIRVAGRLRTDSGIEATIARVAAADPAFARRQATFELTPVAVAAIPEAARDGMSQFTRLLTGTVVLLLLIGCLTVGMLLLIRTEARRGELAMCLALGASRSTLGLGIAIEGALLAAAGALVAIPLAQLFFTGIRAYQLPGRVEIDLLSLGVDRQVLTAAAAAAAAATAIIALVAGAFGLTANIADVLRSRSGATPSLSRRRTRALLVTTQVAVALVLLTGAMLFARSLTAALSLNPRFATSRLVSGNLQLSGFGYSPERASAFFDELRARLGASATIESLSFVERRGSMGGAMTVDGASRRFASAVDFSVIDEAYFPTIGLPVVRGRNFTTADGEGAPRVAIVTESLGRALASGGDGLGRRVTMPFRRIGQPADVMEVVGVVPDVITSVRALQPLVMYFPRAQSDAGTGREAVIRARGDAAAAAREVVAAINAIDPAVTPPVLRSIDDSLLAQMGPQRFGATVMSALGTLAALLTILGIYVMAESMAGIRRREMGIRAALGASRVQLGGIILRETVTLVGLGLAAGLALAWLGASTIRALLFQVQPMDVTTLVAVSATLLLLAIAVTLKPATRAGNVELARVLRED